MTISAITKRRVALFSVLVLSWVQPLEAIGADLCVAPSRELLQREFVSACGFDGWTADKLSARMGAHHGEEYVPEGLTMMSLLSAYDMCEELDGAAETACTMFVQSQMDCIQEVLRILSNC